MSNPKQNSRTPKRPMGRPKIKLSQFPKDWKETLIKMGEEGQLDIDAKAYLHIFNDTFERLMKEEPEFLETISMMRQLSHVWWAKLPRDAFKSGNSKMMNSQLYSLVMRNKFKDEWNHAEQKVDITTQGDKLDSNRKIEIEIVKTKVDGKETNGEQ